VLHATFEINSCCHHALRRSPKILALRSLRRAPICRVLEGPTSLEILPRPVIWPPFMARARLIWFLRQASLRQLARNIHTCSHPCGLSLNCVTLQSTESPSSPYSFDKSQFNLRRLVAVHFLQYLQSGRPCLSLSSAAFRPVLPTCSSELSNSRARILEQDSLSGGRRLY
jgi:hypothetical protein